jgi:hypothetical protein
MKAEQHFYLRIIFGNLCEIIIYISKFIRQKKMKTGDAKYIDEGSSI